MKIKIPELPKLERATKRKIILIALFVIGVLTMITYFAVRVALWFDSNKVTFNSPLVVKTQKVVVIEKRIPEVIVKEVVTTYPNEIKTDIEKYICDKFGIADCKTAVAIARAESGLRCDAIGINSNSADIGIFQLNTVHLKKGGDWTLTNMGDCYKNIDLAYELFTEQGGFQAWVAYTSGSYIAKY